jgi:hypothetical protein
MPDRRPRVREEPSLIFPFPFPSPAPGKPG